MLRCVASFFSFSTHAPIYGVTLAQSKGSVARAASTHAPAMGATESTNRIGVAGDASTHAHGGDRWWMSVRITLMRLQLTHPLTGCDNV